jgi:hypothetical protein
MNFFGHHFLRYYIQNNPNLEKNATNKAILDAVLNCKEKERAFGSYHNLTHLIVSLADLERFHISDEYLPAAIKEVLVPFFKSLTNEDLIKPQILWHDMTLLEVVCQPLIKDKFKTSAFTSLTEMV